MARKDEHHAAIDALRHVPLFGECTANELDAIGRLSTPLPVRAGQELCTEGRIGREFVVLVEGEALVSKRSGWSRTAGPGAFFGELSLLDDGPRTATVTMTTDGLVLAMSSTEFRALLRSVPEIAIRMLPVLARRLREVGEGEGEGEEAATGDH